MNEPNKKAIANRENGKLGGVKTEEGKAVSSKNALIHGILAKTSTPFDVINLQELVELLNEEFPGEALTHKLLVFELGVTILRMARCKRAEADLILEALNPRVVETRSLSDMIKIEETIVKKHGKPAPLSDVALGKLSLIYDRYEPKLFNRFVKILNNLKTNP